MGAGDVDVVSKHMVRPSSATPSHLKIVKLSLLDQLAPPRYLPMIFFYEADDMIRRAENPAKLCQNLKESLSKTLASYYPLAGKADLRNSFVECTDDGVEFVEARVHARLSDVLMDPDLEVLKNKHLPLDPLGGMYAGEGGPLFAAQVNFFDCGGISVGVCISHSVADTKCLVQFVNEWATVFRNDNYKISPSSSSSDSIISLHDFDALSRFSPAAQDLSSWNFSDSLIMGNKDMIFTKSYVFNKEKLRALEKIATTSQSQLLAAGSTSDLVDNRPSGVELVTAFIWKEFISNNWAANKAFGVTLSVDIRSASLKLENAFGNCYEMALAITPPTEVMCLPQLEELVSKLRKVINEVNDEYSRKVLADQNQYLAGLSQIHDAMVMGGMDGCTFGSWCGFPLYEIDFGWGKPVKVSTTALLHDRLNFLIDTRCGQGIEAFVNMNYHNIEAFETHFNHL